ncbi:MAG: right-handed parallel beta-helix repeat-containing protein [Phycisphaerae bacterium]
MCLTSLSTAALLAALATPAPAVERFVPAQYATIQAAIDACADGDVVTVADGVYQGDGNTNLDFGGRAITVRSQNGASSCTIDLNFEDRRAFRFHSGETSASSVEGFTIRHGLAWSPNPTTILCVGSSPRIAGCLFASNFVNASFFAVQGGAILCLQRSNPIIVGCEFRENRAHEAFNSRGLGGAIACFDASSPLISACLFYKNSADDGGGAVYLESSRAVIAHCRFWENKTVVTGFPESVDSGGGAILAVNSSPAITSCEFGKQILDRDLQGNPRFTLPNESWRGAAILATGASTLSITNCTFADNSQSAAVRFVGDDAKGMLTNCILWGNGVAQIQSDSAATTLRYCDVQGGWAGAGANNLNVDPLFKERFTQPGDPFNGVYFLSHAGLPGQPVDSPCKDAGSATAIDLGLHAYTTRTDLQADEDAVDLGYHISRDCNGNGQWDRRDIGLGVSADCNYNGIPDSCDIAESRSPDANEDGVPDDCQCRPARGDFSSDADFELGWLVNLRHTLAGDALERNQDAIPLPYLWAPLSGLSRVIRVNTLTGDVQGDYATAPANQLGDPSRTAVDLDGNLWIANRNDLAFPGTGSVVKVGYVVGGTRCDGAGFPDPLGDYLKPPFVYSSCVDRNRDGLIATSRGLGDVRAWYDLSPENATADDADDECICRYVAVRGTGVRHLSVDKSNNLWTGGRDNHLFDVVDGFTGAAQPVSFSVMGGGYGGLIDYAGYLWSAERLGVDSGRLLRVDTTSAQNPLPAIVCSGSADTYTVTTGRLGQVWTTEFAANEIRQIAADGTLLTSIGTGDPDGDRGIAMTVSDDGLLALVASSGGATVSRILLQPDPPDPLSIALGEDGLEPTGLAVDPAGMVWATCRTGNTLKRINPATQPSGPHVDLTITLPANAAPYSYTDQTGQLTLHNTGIGTWTVVHDGGTFNAEWHLLRWNREGVCDDPLPGDLEVSVRAADQRTELTARAFAAVEEGRRFDDVRGRYLEIRVRFCGAGPDVLPHSPVLCDLSASHGLGDLNCDGVVNNFDVGHFSQAVIDPAGYVADHDGDPYAPCDAMLADLNGDGLVNNFDIDILVELILGC